MPSGAAAAEEYLLGLANFHTIYETLAGAGHNWNVYYHDFTLAWIFDGLRPYPEKFQPFGQFLEDAKNGHLPSYSFLEPLYFIGARSDEHPPHNVWEGERLIARVYDALRSNEGAWLETLLLVLWDEHGGFYDHEPPRPTVSPHGERSREGFDFTALHQNGHGPWPTRAS